jgi:hypothetical protein
VQVWRAELQGHDHEAGEKKAAEDPELQKVGRAA